MKSNGRKKVFFLILFCKHTISQSTAYMGDSADLTDVLNCLVEIKPRNKETGSYFTDQKCVHHVLKIYVSNINKARRY